MERVVHRKLEKEGEVELELSKEGNRQELIGSDFVKFERARKRIKKRERDGRKIEREGEREFVIEQEKRKFERLRMQKRGLLEVTEKDRLIDGDKNRDRKGDGNVTCLYLFSYHFMARTVGEYLHLIDRQRKRADREFERLMRQEREKPSIGF